MTEQPPDAAAVLDPDYLAGIEALPAKGLRERRRHAGALHQELDDRLIQVESQLAATDHSGASAEQAAERQRLHGTAAVTARERESVREVYEALGNEIGRRYRLGLTSVDEMMRD